MDKRHEDLNGRFTIPLAFLIGGSVVEVLSKIWFTLVQYVWLTGRC
jgi:hypothetical protein